MIAHEGLPILTSGTAAASFGLASVHRASSNRTPYDAEAVIARFGARRRDQLDIERLGGDVRGIVVSTVQPMHVSLWLHPTARAPAG